MRKSKRHVKSHRETSKLPRPHWSRVSYDQLEARRALAVAAAFSSGTLTVSLSAANDAAFLQVDSGGKLDVGTASGSSNVYNGNDAVTRIVVQDTGAVTGQAVTFGGIAAFSLPNGLASSGVETSTFNQAVNLGNGLTALSVNAATAIKVNAAIVSEGGGITLSASSGITLSNALISGGGNISLQADADADGIGGLTLSAAAMSSWSQQAQITTSDGAGGDQFGNSVAISSDGNTAVVGGGLDDVGTKVDQGTARVFVRTAGAWWTQQAILTASGGVGGDRFGSSVAISSNGDTVIVGVQSDDVGANKDQGSAVIFTRSGGVWTQQQQITSSDGAAGDGFGWSVAISSDGDTAIVGSPSALNNRGRAAVFTRSSGAWSQQQQFTFEGYALKTASFGLSVSISSDGNTAILGAPYLDIGLNSKLGSAFLFTRANGFWTQKHQFIDTDSTAAADNNYGVSVAISGDANTVIVGEWQDDVGAVVNQGSARVYARYANTWNMQAKLTLPTALSGSRFGGQVALSGDGNTAMVAATYDAQDSVTAFIRSGSSWTQQQKLTAPGGTFDEQFGQAIAISKDGSTLCVGSPQYKSLQGAGYVFSLIPAPGGSINTGAGIVSVTAADVDLQGSISANAVTLNVAQANRPINLGANAAGALGLTSGELNLISSGTIQVGDSSSGTLTVSSNISRTASTDIVLNCSGDIVASGGLFNTAGGTMLLNPGVTGSVKPTKSGVDFSAGTVSFASSSDLRVNINGTTVDSQYTQLRVTGAVNLTGVDLVLTGSYTFGPSDVLTIVSCTSRTGAFNGLPQGATIPFGSQFLLINYTATGVTLKLKPNLPPTLDALSDLAIDEDASQQTVNLSGITAGAGESQLLRVTASSGNPALVPDPSVSYTSADSTGSISFTPVANQFGVVTITITVEDGGWDGNLSTTGDNANFSRSFQVTVNPVNDAPTLNALGNLTINEDASQQTVNLSGITAGGGESQPLRVVSSSSNTALIPNPTVSYTSTNSTGSISFKPVTNQSGVAVITVTVEDGGLDANLTTTGDNSTFSRTFQVTVNPVNDPPALNPLSDLTISEDSPEQTVSLAGINAGGGESQTLRVTASSNNTALISSPVVNYNSPDSSGILLFTPVLNQSGVAVITVTVEDGGLDNDLGTPADNASLSRTFQVTVNPVNDAPTLDAISSLTLNEDDPLQTVNLSGISAGGGESQPLRVTSSSNNTALIPNPTVNYSSANTTGSISFKPVANQSGVATITVKVEDGGLDGNLTTTADNGSFSRTFKVTVNPVNDAPTLNALSDLAIDEDALQQTVNLSGITAGGGESQPLRITAVSSNTAVIPSPSVSYTSANSTGSISFKPVGDQSGAATVTVTVEDGGLDGNLDTTGDNASFSRTFQVTVKPINDLPTLNSLGDLTLNEDAPPQTVNLAGITAGGGEAQPLRVISGSNNSGLINSPVVNYNSPDPTGTLQLTLMPNQFGTAIITVTVEDGGLDRDLSTPVDNAVFSRTFQVTVNPVNDLPTLEPLADLTINEDAPPQSVNLAGIAAGGGESQPLRVTASCNNTGLIPNPTVNYSSANPTGSISFTPVANQSGVATITVMVEDGGLDGNLSTSSDNATFSRTFQVMVNSVNDLPTLDALNNLTIDEDAPQQTVNLAGVTAGGGESQPLRVTTNSTNTGLIPSPNVNYISANTTGSISFTPVANQSGVATITVTVEDGGLDGNLSTTGDNASFTRNFNVVVEALNDTPNLDALDDVSIDEDALEQTINLSGIGAGGGESQPLRVSAASNNIGLIPNPIVIYKSADTTGSIAFKPIANQSGIANITVTVEDGGLDNDLNTTADNARFSRAFQVMVKPVNDAPTLEPLGDLTLNEDAPQKTVNLTGISAGGDETQPLRVSASSSNTALVPNPAVNYNSPNQNGAVSFTPAANQSGKATITVTVEDGGLDNNLDTSADNATFSRTFTVTVTPVNDAPVLTNLGGDITYRENQVIARISNNASIQDIDTPVFINGTLQVAIESGGEPKDRLWITPSGGLTISGNEVLFNGVVIGTSSGGTEGQPLLVKFNNRTSVARAQFVLRNVCFAHDSDNPQPMPRAISIRVTDGSGGQATASKVVKVIPVNDAPKVTGIPTVSNYTLNASAVTIAPDALINDPDSQDFGGGQLNVRFTSAADASNRLAIGGGFTVDSGNNILRNGVIIGQRNEGGGTGSTNLQITLTGNATRAIVQELLRGISFRTVNGTSKEARTLEIFLSDGDGGNSVTQTQIDVT